MWSKNESEIDASSNFVVDDQSWRIETVTSFFATSFQFENLKVIEVKQFYEFLWACMWGINKWTEIKRDHDFKYKKETRDLRWILGPTEECLAPIYASLGNMRLTVVNIKIF